MQAPIEWIAISYTVPAKPSKARVYVWRHLRALHAESINPGLSVLPDNEENRLAFATLAQEVGNFGGEALLMRFEFLDKADEENIKSRFSLAAREEEKALLERFESISDRLADSEDTSKKAVLRELRQAMTRFEKSPLRAFESTDAKSELSKAANDMFGTLRSLSGEITQLFRSVKPTPPTIKED